MENGRYFTGEGKYPVNIGKRLMAAALCAGMLLSGCGSPEAVETEGAILVDAASVGRDTLVLSNQFVGNISPEESVYIIPLAQGKVTETFFEVGDEVQEGDVLFKIDDSGAKLQLEQAQLSLKSAQQQADSALTTQQDSTNLTLDSNMSTVQQQYETLQVQWVDLKDKLDTAQKAVDKLKKAVKELKKAYEAFPSEELAAQLADMQEKLATARTTRDTLQTNFDSLTVSYEAAKRSMDLLEAQKNLTQGAVLEDTKEQLNTSLSLANLGVESAELALSYYQVTTPISGKVISKNVEVNGMATSSSPAYIIAGENTMTATFQVSESVRNTLHKDMKIVVERNGAEYDGVITEVGNAVNAQTGLFQIKAAVNANGEELPGGVSVKITSDTYVARDAIIIPYDAVYYENDGAYVYTVQDGHAVKTYVTVGIFDDERIEIADGLTEADVIITSWSPRLIDGAEVEARMTQTTPGTAEPEAANP